MENLNGGSFWGKVCMSITVGSVVYYIGAETQQWNPIGWVCDFFVVADVACLFYTAANQS